MGGWRHSDGWRRWRWTDNDWRIAFASLSAFSQSPDARLSYRINLFSIRASECFVRQWDIRYWPMAWHFVCQVFRRAFMCNTIAAVDFFNVLCSRREPRERMRYKQTAQKECIAQPSNTPQRIRCYGRVICVHPNPELFTFQLFLFPHIMLTHSMPRFLVCFSSRYE